MGKLVRCEDRLKNMMIIDKKENPARIERVLKSEILNVLKNYFEITGEDVDVVLSVGENGRYVFSVTGESRSIKIARLF